MTRRKRLSTRLARLLLGLLGDRGSWSGGTDSGTSIDGRPVAWFLTAQRAGSRITLLETVTVPDQSSRVVRYWLLAPDPEGSWHLEAAEKNHEALDNDWINDELEEAIGRLEDPQTARSFLEVPKARTLAPVVPSPISGLWPRRFRAIAGLAFFVCAFFILMAYSSLQYHRMIRLVGDLNSAIGISSTKQIQAVTTLSDRLAALDGELEKLRDDVQRERAAFEFSRKNTAMTIRSQADELPWEDYSRKRAYNYLADRIESAGSYGEIIHQISRIPEDNAQAETIMAVDRANIVPLSSYVATVEGLSYPVRLDGKEADGGDFMISSGFGELRPSSLGTGGYLPHMAVDIINVRNILTVTADNSIVRFPGEPGSAVAAADGVVIESGYNSVYGWFAEISHGSKPEWTSRYRNLELLSTYYSHLAEDPGWKEGDRIQRNEKVGKIGDTGRATGPHLHFEVRVYRPGGEFVNKTGHFDRMNPYIPAE
ncbi:MAG: M23 family metallopeptidase [Spirochaetaceae bacterium]|nr:M23 family metallopeptidase [Spirochaetaceae bacterium]